MKLKEVEDYLLEHDVEDYELFEEEVQESRLWLEQRAIHIPKYNIKIREGLCELWDADSEDYELDHTCYMMFDMLTNEYLYSEIGSGMCVSLHNFLLLNNKQHLAYDDLLDLECEVHVCNNENTLSK